MGHDPNKKQVRRYDGTHFLKYEFRVDSRYMIFAFCCSGDRLSSVRCPQRLNVQPILWSLRPGNREVTATRRHGAFVRERPGRHAAGFPSRGIGEEDPDEEVRQSRHVRHESLF